MVRQLAGVHDGIHSGKTRGSATRETPEGISNAGEGSHTGDQADVEARHDRISETGVKERHSEKKDGFPDQLNERHWEEQTNVSISGGVVGEIWIST